MSNFKNMCQELEAQIQNAYTEGISLDEAEKLASKFLSAQLAVSAELTKKDLDSRMRKSGVKAVRAAIYLDILQKNDKKPTETAIASTIDSDKIVLDEQEGLDKAEVERDELKRYYDIFCNAHIHFRSVAKGSFGS